MSKKEILIQAILGSLFMALMMSGVISLSKVGLNLHWLSAWRDSFFVAWPVAFALNLTVMPQIRRLAHWLALLGENKPTAD
ncbi:hypothetical protein XM72_c11441 [Vibrio vulnificus]|uniref:DUF2798 domain-containing protein n=1 Tax=Vibrio vulnificus TaxID=672 RepID=UPI0009B6013B|nr:DUF2798 domain-containing protein [Vibrio vulnificus]OQK43394.1 hypothetical protein XM72_c11441 [Vibrio vulnificus]